jgi:DNA-binding IclR family transcriptional regulator
VILSCAPRPLLVKVYEAHAGDAAGQGLGKTWTDFRSSLAAIRREGFYLSRGELERGVGGAAVPIADADGDAAAALALVGTVASLDAAGEPRLRTLLARAREDIQQRLAQGVRLPRTERAATVKAVRRPPARA